MKDQIADVKSKSVKVGEATFRVYESSNEAKDDLGEDVIVGFINQVTKNNAIQRVRSEKTAKPTKAQFMLDAFRSFTPEEQAEYAGNQVAFDAAILQKADAAAKKWDEESAARQAVVASAQSNDEVEEDDD